MAVAETESFAAARRAWLSCSSAVEATPSNLNATLANAFVLSPSRVSPAPRYDLTNHTSFA